MRSRPVLLGLSIVVAIAALFVWTLAPRDARTPPPLSAPPPSAAPSPPEATADSTTIRAAPDADDTSVATGEDEGTPSAPAAIDATRTPVHTTRIVGRVTDPSGGGIRDVRVLARARAAADASDELDAARERETTSDAAGRFEIAGLHPGPIELVLSSASWAPRRSGGLVVPTDGALDVGDIALDLPVLLLGRVVDEHGRAIGGARVLARNAHPLPPIDERAIVVTRDDGTFACAPLAAGEWTLDAITDGQVVGRATGTASPGQTISDLEVELARGGSIRGYVTGADASELATLLVVARPVADWTDAPLDRDESRTADSETRRALAAALRGERRSTVDDDGRFELAGLQPARTYEVVVGPRAGPRTPTLAGGRARAALGLERGADDPIDTDVDKGLARVRARPSALEIELALPRPARLAFEVRSSDARAPIEDFVFALEGAAPVTLLDERAEPLARHPNGRVALDGFRALGADLCTLSIVALGHARTSFTFAASAGRPIDLGPLILRRTRTIALRVSDAATGQPIHGAEVRAREIDAARDAENGIAHATSDEHGAARVTTFDESGSRITIAAAGYAALELSGPFERTRDPLDVPMSAGASIVAHVASEDGDALPAVEVIVERPDPQSGDQWIPSAPSVWTGADGVAHVPRLAPDLHRVFLGTNDRVSDRDVALITLRAGDTRELWITAARAHALLVTVVDGRAAVAGIPVELLDAAASVRIAETITDAAGRARFPRVRRGAYALALTLDGSYGTRPVAIDDGDAHVTIDVAESALHGVVRSPSGAAVESAEVAIESTFDAQLYGLLDASGAVPEIEAAVARAARAHRDHAGVPRARAVTDGAGRFRLRGLVAGNAYTVRAWLGSRAAGARHLESFRPGSEIAVPLSDCGALEISLRNITGAVQPLLVVLRPLDDERDFARALAWDARTVLHVDGLVEGTWTVRACSATAEPGVLATFGALREIGVARGGVAALEIAWP